MIVVLTSGLLKYGSTSYYNKCLGNDDDIIYNIKNSLVPSKLN